MSHLFLSRPQPEEKAVRDGSLPHRSEIPAVFVTSGSDLLTRSMVALNIAVALGLDGAGTTLVDADPAAPTAHLLAGGAIDSIDGTTRLRLGAGRFLALVVGAGEVDSRTRYVIINAPAAQWLEGRPVDGVRNLLLVTSPSILEGLSGFAIVKRAAAANAALRLGIIAADVANEEAGRLLYENCATVFARHTPAVASFCGWLSPRDRIGRSIRERVPALLGHAEPDLSDRLRRITAAAAGLFDLEVWNQELLSADPRSESARNRHLGLTEDEIGDLLRTMHPRDDASPGIC